MTNDDTDTIAYEQALDILSDNSSKTAHLSPAQRDAVMARIGYLEFELGMADVVKAADDGRVQFWRDLAQEHKAELDALRAINND